MHCRISASVSSEDDRSSCEFRPSIPVLDKREHTDTALGIPRDCRSKDTRAGVVRESLLVSSLVALSSCVSTGAMTTTMKENIIHTSLDERATQRNEDDR
jgi:hypothetical protein